MWGAIAGAAAQAGGGIYGVAEARRNARNQRDWTLEMSQTAHQREVADLRKAGLNPILSAGGKGAAIGPGATAQTPDLAAAAGGAVNTALAAKRTKADVDQVQTATQRQALDLKLEKDAIRYYEDNPTVQKATAAGLLADKAGINPSAGGLVGAASTAKQAFFDAIDRSTMPSVRKHYETLNKDVGKSPEQLKREAQDRHNKLNNRSSIRLNTRKR